MSHADAPGVSREQRRGGDEAESLPRPWHLRLAPTASTPAVSEVSVDVVKEGRKTKFAIFVSYICVDDGPKFRAHFAQLAQPKFRKTLRETLTQGNSQRPTELVQLIAGLEKPSRIETDVGFFRFPLVNVRYT